jgi:hypothetical protein
MTDVQETAYEDGDLVVVNVEICQAINRMAQTTFVEIAVERKEGD